MALYESEEDALNAYGDVYRHYKGGIYRALDIARHTETQELMVVYEHLWPHEHGIFVRPQEMFFGYLDDGKRRFEPIERH